MLTVTSEDVLKQAKRQVWYHKVRYTMHLLFLMFVKAVCVLFLYKVIKVLKCM